MKLGEFLQSKAKRPSQFAGEIGVSASTITRFLKGERGITLDVARKIVAGTEGSVTLEELAGAGASSGALSAKTAAE